jgi:hypothetical protein
VAIVVGFVLLVARWLGTRGRWLPRSRPRAARRWCTSLGARNTCPVRYLRLLNCLAAAVPPQERVVTAEEVFELKIPLPDVVSLQCRQPSLEGTGEIKLRRLVKEGLRMRPSRMMGLVIAGRRTSADQ